MSRPDTQAAIGFYDIFATTQFGKKLGGENRFRRYNLADVSPEDWANMLGPDVNNLEHMRYTTTLAAYYISQHERYGDNPLTPEEQEELLVAASIHDQGEAFDGDITYSEKTITDETAERQKSMEAAQQLLPGLSADQYKVIAEIRAGIVFDKTSRLGQMFAVIEHMGYIQTALKAQAHIEYNHTIRRTPTEDGLRWLVVDVLMNNFDGFVNVNTDPVLKRFIQNRRDFITIAFENADTESFVHYGHEAAAKQGKFMRARRNWDAIRKQYDPERVRVA